MRDGNVYIQDIHTNQLLHELKGDGSPITSIGVNDDNVVAVSDYITVRIWNINTGQRLRGPTKHTHSIKLLRVAKNKMVTGSFHNTIRIWPLFYRL